MIVEDGDSRLEPPRTPPRGRILVALLAVLLAWGALWLVRPAAGPAPSAAHSTVATGPQPGRLGEPPDKVGSLFVCKEGEQISAYLVGKLYFTANHPLRPDTSVPPARCFTTKEEAEAAGYSAAPPPPGTFEVDGVYLVFFDYSGDMVQGCLRAANRLGFAVPCPSVLPNPAAGVDPPGCDQPGILPTRSCMYRGTFVFEYSGFSVPPGYEGSGTRIDIGAFRKETLEKDPGLGRVFVCEAEDDRGIFESLKPPLTDLPVDRLKYSWCTQGIPPFGQELLLRWTDRGITYQVGVYGDTPANHDLLEAVVLHLHLVRPTLVSATP